MATFVTQTMLDEARAAFHQIAIGGGVAKFRDSNGEEVSYSRVNLDQLRNYIAWLERELGSTTSVAPMQVWM